MKQLFGLEGKGSNSGHLHPSGVKANYSTLGQTKCERDIQETSYRFKNNVCTRDCGPHKCTYWYSMFLFAQIVILRCKLNFLTNFGEHAKMENTKQLCIGNIYYEGHNSLHLMKNWPSYSPLLERKRERYVQCHVSCKEKGLWRKIVELRNETSRTITESPSWIQSELVKVTLVLAFFLNLSKKRAKKKRRRKEIWLKNDL